MSNLYMPQRFDEHSHLSVYATHSDVEGMFYATILESLNTVKPSDFNFRDPAPHFHTTKQYHERLYKEALSAIDDTLREDSQPESQTTLKFTEDIDRIHHATAVFMANYVATDIKSVRPKLRQSHIDTKDLEYMKTWSPFTQLNDHLDAIKQLDGSIKKQILVRTIGFLGVTTALAPKSTPFR